MREESENSDAAMLGALFGTVGLVLVLALTAVIIALRSRNTNATNSGTHHSRAMAGSPSLEQQQQQQNTEDEVEDGESPTTLLPCSSSKLSSTASQLHQQGQGRGEYLQECPDLIGGGGTTTGGGREIDRKSASPQIDTDIGLFYHKNRSSSSANYNALTPVSSVSNSNNSTLSKAELHLERQMSSTEPGAYCHDLLYDYSESDVMSPTVYSASTLGSRDTAGRDTSLKDSIRSSNIKDNARGSDLKDSVRSSDLKDSSRNTIARETVRSTTARDTMRELDRIRGSTLQRPSEFSRPAPMHYVRSQNITQVAQERESFL